MSKVRQLLGGELKLIASGSAPLNPKVFNFLRIVFSCTVAEGYGATETCAPCLRLAPGDPTGPGCVGFPSPCNEAKLIDVPSMGYSVQDKPFPRGELLIRGDAVLTRYHKSEFSSLAPIPASRGLRCSHYLQTLRVPRRRRMMMAGFTPAMLPPLMNVEDSKLLIVSR